MSVTTAVEETDEMTAIRMTTHSDGAELAKIVREVDEGRLELFIADRRPLVDMIDAHANPPSGKTVFVV